MEKKKSKENNSNDIKELSTIEHILIRPNTYLGGTKPAQFMEWVLDENDKLVYRPLSYTEGLKKCCTEIVDNSVDEYIKTNGKFSTKISITIDKNTFTCEDNGRGIPVKKTQTGEWMPMVALCRPMSGSNFTDDNRLSIGTNGLGAKIASVFSKSFDAVTCDGKGKLKITSKNNLSDIKVTELSASVKTGTKITFVPDFERFGVKDFGNEIEMMLKTRLKFLSWFCPNCVFTLNGERISFKPKDFISLFPESSVTLSNDNVYICIYPSDEPNILSYVNTMSLRRGGTHIDYITNKIVSDIRDKVSKKFKNIKPADIKNRLSFVVFFNNFPNCSFDSQTKEALTNAQSEISEFLNANNIDLDKLSAKILKEKDIIDNITDIFKAKEELAEKKNLAKLNKTKKEVESEKYFPPIGKSTKKYLFITEGFSAGSAMIPILGRNNHGFYFLKGKPMNIYGVKPVTFMANQEINELVNILGINLADPDSDMTYEKVVILSDQDPDGCDIAGLAINIFARIAPKMLKDGRICILETPLLLGMKNNKVEDYFFSMPKKSDMKKGLDYKYLKGLGSWEKSWFNQVLEKEGDLSKLFKSFEVDKDAIAMLDKWFSGNSEPRKEVLRGREFHIDKM